MTCYRSRDNWHSYVKSSLSKAELDEMTSHLENCQECSVVVSIIQDTVGCFAKSRVNFPPPASIKINVMMGIDKTMYKDNLSYANSLNQISLKKAADSHLFALRNWGFSMIAAGILLFTLNLASLTPNFEAGQINEWHIKLNKQMTIPFDKMSQVANDALGKIESLTLPKHK